jgi:uncharacterized protein (TIGR02217 family)
MSFHDINLPDFLAIFAIGTPEFATSCAVSKSGRESRSLDIAYPFHKYVLKDCRLSSEQFYQFKSFFQARAGRMYSFRMKDYADFKVQKQVIAKGDSSSTQINLYKLYSDEIAPFYRKITKPKKNKVQLFIGDNNLSDFTISDLTGLISLKTPIEQDKIVLASFEFDVCVRFANDTFEYKSMPDGSIELINVELIEVEV